MPDLFDTLEESKDIFDEIQPPAADALRSSRPFIPEGVLPRFQNPFQHITVPSGTPLQEQARLGWEDINRPVVEFPPESIALAAGASLPPAAQRLLVSSPQFRGLARTAASFASGLTSPLGVSSMGAATVFPRIVGA